VELRSHLHASAAFISVQSLILIGIDKTGSTRKLVKDYVNILNRYGVKYLKISQTKPVFVVRTVSIP